ncbi:MAG: type II secretion system F family protein [Oceanicaulis sp.]|uniref:type II secretion system F family protein n=1 Tax=Glycocaulis sp. TaxID=1969725 RepID=UPI0025C327DA|nr:type II secretion system F family protein [Glycocaulis sp.]MCC5981844.1 type II secretion system F family protein [Oceanicaulis sp.]MCH8522676.1 type II secretion system F family protein [Glycocaulis sp.]
MLEFARWITDPGNLFGIIAFVLVFATILTLSAPAMGGNKLERRIRSVANRREELRRKSREALEQEARGSALRGKDTRSPYRKVVEKLNLQTLLEDPNLKTKLIQAGMRGQGPVFAFYFARLIAPIALFILSLAYLFALNDFGLPTIQRIGIVMALTLLGYYAPGIYLTNAAQKRRDSIMRAFPDALDLLLICVEAGMSVEAAFQKVASEVGTTSMELAEELSLTTAELAYLQDRRQAYENLAYRTNHPGVKGVCTALVQAERYGTPLGQALRVMAKENRDMRMAAAEKKAAALPAKLTVPMIIFFLPVLFVVILGPAIISFQEM